VNTKPRFESDGDASSVGGASPNGGSRGTARGAQRIGRGRTGAVALYGVVSSLVRKVMMLVYSVLFVRIIGVDLYALFVAFETVARPLSIVGALGGQTMLINEIAQAEAKRRRRRSAAVVVAALLITVGLGALSSIAVHVWAGPISSMLGDLPGLENLLRSFSWVVVLLILMTVASAVLVGFGHASRMFTLFHLVEPIGKILGLVPLLLIITFAAGTWHIVLLPEIVGMTLVLVGAAWFLRRERSLQRMSVRAGAAEVAPLAIMGLPLVVHSFSAIALGYTDKAMVAGIIGETFDLAVYSIAFTLAGLTVLFHRNISKVVGPQISEAMAEGDRARILDLYQKSSEVSFVLAGAGYLVLLIFGQEILALYDDQFSGYVLLLAVIAWGPLINTFTGCGEYILVAQGRGRYLMWNGVVTVVINVALNYVLISSYGVLGAAIATAASSIFRNLLGLVEVFLLSRLHPVTIPHALSALVVGGVTLVYFSLDLGDWTVGIRLLLVLGIGCAGLALLLLRHPRLLRIIQAKLSRR
jgi:O-antigen/teichoic acid export membrane protein